MAAKPLTFTFSNKGGAMMSPNKFSALLIAVLAIFPLRAWAWNGGITGGGGNLIEPVAAPVHASPEIAKRIIVRSLASLERYLQEKHSLFMSGDLPGGEEAAFAPIFLSQRSIEDVIENTRLLIPDEHSCRDAGHRPVDGSVVTPEPNAICISAYNIAHKTAPEDIPPQAVALLLHEYSELVGLDEQQAVRAQAAALEEFRKARP